MAILERIYSATSALGYPGTALLMFIENVFPPPPAVIVLLAGFAAAAFGPTALLPAGSPVGRNADPLS